MNGPGVHTRVLAVLGLLLASLCSPSAGGGEPQKAGLTVHFINVGHGDAVLIDYGECEVLIDGGRSPGFVAGYIAP